jgi:hypothetical protein
MALHFSIVTPGAPRLRFFQRSILPGVTCTWVQTRGRLSIGTCTRTRVVTLSIASFARPPRTSTKSGTRTESGSLASETLDECYTDYQWSLLRSPQENPST